MSDKTYHKSNEKWEILGIRIDKSICHHGRHLLIQCQWSALSHASRMQMDVVHVATVYWTFIQATICLNSKLGLTGQTRCRSRPASFSCNLCVAQTPRTEDPCQYFFSIHMGALGGHQVIANLLCSRQQLVGYS